MATYPTHSPGTRASVVRTPTPSAEISVVTAELSALKFSASNTSLIGIAADRRSDRRGTEGISVGIGCPPASIRSPVITPCYPSNGVSSNRVSPRLAMKGHGSSCLQDITITHPHTYLGTHFLRTIGSTRCGAWRKGQPEAEMQLVDSAMANRLTIRLVRELLS